MGSPARFLVGAAIACTLVASPAVGQGAFDMGVLTNTVSQDHLAQSERKRAERTRPAPTARSESSSASLKARAHCRNARQVAASGSTDPRLGQLLALCDRARY